MTTSAFSVAMPQPLRLPLAAAAACPQGYRIVENVAPRDYYNSSLVFACRTE